MGEEQQVVIPAEILRKFEEGDDARHTWVSALPSIAHDLARRWDLRPDGAIRSGEAGILVPVRRSDGTQAALKLQAPSPETRAAILGLARWDGRGAVRLLDSDTEQGGMLLERLHGDRSLETIDDDEVAIRIVGGLLTQLHSAPAPDGLPALGAILAEMIDGTPSAMRLLDSDDQSRIDRWARRIAEVESEPGTHLLHWDLHYGNVLAADREPWLAIDPEPLVGDAGFDLWPALDSGWSADGGVADAPRIVRRRFDILTEMLALDRDRAAAWTLARLLQNTLWDIEDGHHAISGPAKTLDDALRTFGA